MQTLESIRKRIKSAEELESVVKAMKALAAVSIRQYEKAVESLSDYSRTIELGLQVVLAQGLDDLPSLKPPESTQFGAVIFGSQQGLSGQFNSQIASFALSRLAELGIGADRRRVMALGERVVPELEEAGLGPQKQSPLPWSVTGITRAVRRTVMDIDEWRFREGIGEIMLFHHRQLSGASYSPTSVYLFPLDPEWLGRWEKRGWASRTLPMYTMERRTILSSLIRQHLFITLFRAFAESLAAENASRLSSMQSAEKNIGDRLGELSTRFQRIRQSSITSEILDIVSGFEALRETNGY
jgi:F-type H+-transporting ATPase subunit gamma